MGFKELLQETGFMKKDEVVQHNTPVVANPVVTSFGAAAAVQSATPFNSKTDYDKYIEDELEKNNPPGFDFREFSKMILGMASKPLTEQAKFETAYEAAKSMNITPMQLINSGGTYQGVLVRIEGEFAAEHQGAIANKVESKKAEIARLTAENTELASRIEANNKKSQELNISLLDTQNVLGGEKAAFEYALNNKKAFYADMLTKIQTYLNGTTS